MQHGNSFERIGTSRPPRTGVNVNAVNAQATPMTSKASTAKQAGKAASAALKHGALKGGAMLGAKGLAAGGALGAFAVRRVATPFLWAGGAVCAAGWFGAFEAALSVTKIACPVPAKPDERAQMLGVATVPVTGGAILWAGWQLAPAYANPAEAGLMAFAKSLPLRHAAMVGAASATASAVCCRVVQHRNGA